MNGSASTIIIGGGVAGASVAYHLAERGMTDVIVLERSANLGSGSTGKATGGVRAQFETDVNIRQSLYSLDFFRDWEYDAGYDPKGYIFLATSDLHLEYLTRTIRRQRELGYDGVRLISRSEIAEMVPGLNVEDVVGGSFGPRDGFIDPLAVTRGFIDGAERGGVRLLTGVEVKRVVVERDRIAGVHTADAVIECENIVLAAGAWSAKIAATAGIDLPVRPQRRQIAWAHAPERLPADTPMVIDLTDGFHFRPARDFTNPSAAPDPHDVLFAWPDPAEPSSFSTEFDEAFLEKVRERARHRAPFLNQARIVREKCRAGLYENTPDHHAILGPCGPQGLYLATGFSGHGVMHSPATGRALTEYILDGKVSFMDVSQLSFERFAKGELLHETSFI